MLIYLEKQVKSVELTKKILAKYPNAQILEIDHYKNIFDKKIGNQRLAPSLILAKAPKHSVVPAPENYGYTKYSFFIRTSLNCVFDCKYCYLQGAFKNSFPVIFVNYEDIAEEIEKTIVDTKKIISEKGDNLNSEKPEICFYANNYSDGLALDAITEFHNYFIPFFHKFDKVILESRTKSANIQSLLDFSNNTTSSSNPHCKGGNSRGDLKTTNFPNFEIAFSLNPETIVQELEIGTANLDQRISAINKLLSQGFQVGLRFLPLLPVPNFQKLYQDFLNKIQAEIDLSQIYSVFLGTILYTKSDFKQIQKLYPDREVLDFLELKDDGFYHTKEPFQSQLLDIFQPVFQDTVVQFC